MSMRRELGPCRVRSKLNKFENGWEWSLYNEGEGGQGWSQGSPCVGRGTVALYGEPSEQTDMTENITFPRLH